MSGLVLPSSDIDTVVLDAPMGAITKLGQAMYRRQNQGQVRRVVVAVAVVVVVVVVVVGVGVVVVSGAVMSQLLVGAAGAAVMPRVT